MLSLASPIPVSVSSSDSTLQRKGQKATNVLILFAGCQEDKVLMWRERKGDGQGETPEGGAREEGEGGEKEGAGAREERKAEGVPTRWPGCHWKDSEDTVKRD